LSAPAISTGIRARYALINSRTVLLTGFGGLLILMAYAGFDAVHNMGRIREDNDSIQRGFLTRNQVLNRIRSDLYVSGTYLRDYILEPDPSIAERHRASLERTRREMDALLEQYSTLIDRAEQSPVDELKREVAGYWRAASPALNWNAGERRDRGYAFLRDEVLPRRVNMLALADSIDRVNERQLTEGGLRVATLFAGFQERLLITLGVTLGLGFLLAAFSFYRVLRLERQAAERYYEIVQAREQMKELSSRIVDTQENERRAISRELHDEVGQTLSALMLGIGNLDALLPESAGRELKKNLDEIRALAGKSANVVRNISLALRPSMLDDLGLLPALQWQAREVSRQTNMQVDVAVDESLEQLPDAWKTCIYRVVQEALRNCARHSQAQHVRISVIREDGHVKLSIEDDGRGFEAARDKGLGLLGMQERVKTLGGEFQLLSKPGAGAQIIATLPLARADGKTPSVLSVPLTV